MSTTDELREQVRVRYAQAATAVQAGATNAEVNDKLSDQLTVLEDGCGDSCCGGTTGTVDDSFGAGLYDADQQGALPAEALAASLGCGNPTAVAALRAGELVLYLGSGGGIGVLRLPGASTGADQDVAIARELGLHVWYRVEDVPGYAEAVVATS